MLVHFKECINMEEKLVKIINEMAEHLSIAQMKKLQEVLIKNLCDSEPEKAEISNYDYLQLFYITVLSSYCRKAV